MKGVEKINIFVDGILLQGQMYWPERELVCPGREKSPVIILCHGIPRGNPYLDREQVEDGGYPALAEQCCRDGFPVFHFNFRGTGQSEGNFDLLGWTRDLAAVLDYWEKREGEKRRGFYLWGFSGGAAVSAYVAARNERVKGVALAACPAGFHDLFPEEDVERILARFREIGIIRDSSFPPDPKEWLENIYLVNPLRDVALIAPRPLLVVHGTRDDVVPYVQAYQLYEAAGRPKKLFIVPRAGHQLRKNMKVVSRCRSWFTNIR